MARPTLFEHPKFRRLALLLRMPEPHVLGHLEFLWRVGYACGNPIVGDEIDVELAACWKGQPGEFVAAMTDPKVRMLDRLDDGRYAIHDLSDHAPSYVDGRREREQARRAPRECEHCGSEFRSSESHAKYCSAACRTAACRDRKKEDDDETCNAPSHEACAATVTQVPTIPVSVTQCNGGVTHGNAPVTKCNEPPLSAPLSAPLTKLPVAHGVADEFVAKWNKLKGVTQIRKLAGRRLEHFRARCREPTWLAESDEAMGKFPLLLFQDGGWQPNIDWFLKPDTVTKILEGSYDWRKSDQRQTRRGFSNGPGQKHHPQRPIGDL